MNFIIPFLGVLLAIAGYIIINQNYKIKKYELLMEDSEQNFINSKNLLNKILELIVAAKHRMDRVDKGGSFSGDDEVGFAFKIMNTTIIELSQKLQDLKDIVDGKDSEE